MREAKRMSDTRLPSSTKAEISGHTEAHTRNHRLQLRFIVGVPAHGVVPIPVVVEHTGGPADPL